VIGKTAQLELYDLTPSLLSPSINAQQQPVPYTNLYQLLSRVQTGTKGEPAGYYLFNAKHKRVGDMAETKADLLKAHGGKLPKGWSILAVPNRATVVTCDSTIAVVCPGVTPVPGVTYYYLFKHGTYANDESSPYPQMTGGNLKLSGTRQDFDPTTGEPI